jgi:phage tail protein X
MLESNPGLLEYTVSTMYYGHTVSVTKVVYCSPYITGLSPVLCAIVLFSFV